MGTAPLCSQGRSAGTPLAAVLVHLRPGDSLLAPSLEWHRPPPHPPSTTGNWQSTVTTSKWGHSWCVFRLPGCSPETGKGSPMVPVYQQILRSVRGPVQMPVGCLQNLQRPCNPSGESPHLIQLNLKPHRGSWFRHSARDWVSMHHLEPTHGPPKAPGTHGCVRTGGEFFSHAAGL